MVNLVYEDQFFPMGLVIWVNVGNSTADQDVQSNFLQSNFYVIVQIWSWNGALDGKGLTCNLMKSSQMGSNPTYNI